MQFLQNKQFVYTAVEMGFIYKIEHIYKVYSTKR